MAETVRFKITNRDKEIIHHVARFRFLRSTHIVRLVGGPPAQILRRLQRLYHHGWLDRPRCQLDYFHRGGSHPMVYALGSRGAAFMRREFKLPFQRMEWSGKKSSVGRVFLDHTLMVAEVLVTVELAFRSSDGSVRFVTAAELSMARSNHERPFPFRWNVMIGARKVGLIPDGVFALEYADGTAKPERVVCFLEADRGTMPITRSNANLSSFSRKLKAYTALWKRGDFQDTFGSRRVAVHTVTISADRALNISSAIANLSAGRGLFTCQTLAEFTAAPGSILRRAGPRDIGSSIC
jgi:hypothetical protein